MLEVKGNRELKRPLVKVPSQLPLPGSRFKRGTNQMEDALEPEKVSWILESCMCVYIKERERECVCEPIMEGNYGRHSCFSRKGYEAWAQRPKLTHPTPKHQFSPQCHRHEARLQVGSRGGQRLRAWKPSALQLTYFLAILSYFE